MMGWEVIDMPTDDGPDTSVLPDGTRVARYMVGNDANSVTAIVTLRYRTEATEEDVTRVLTEAAAYGLERFERKD
jgi:hypothetical protein